MIQTHLLVTLLVIILETAGTLLVAWAALSVHHRVLNEHTIDDAVTKTMKREQNFALLGMAMILTSAVLRILFLVF